MSFVAGSTVNISPAVKCNCDPTFLKVLADLGTNFDCASIEEMRTVLSLGVDPARILFANPCKASAAIAFAREAGVLRTTFDNIDELDTIKAHMPEAQLLLRVYANDESAFICLGEKFGAQLDTTEELLSRAWELGLNVIGVSFHVGKANHTLRTRFIKFVNIYQEPVPQILNHLLKQSKMRGLHSRRQSV